VDFDIDVPGKIRRFTFDLAEAGAFVFDTTGIGDGHGQLRFRLDGPDGEVFRNQTTNDFSTANLPFMLGPGGYTVEVDGVADDTGAAAFRILPLADRTPATFDTPVTVTPPGAGFGLISFQGTAGQVVTVETLERSGVTSSFAPQWRVWGPDGGAVANGTYSGAAFSFTLDESGTQTLVLDSRTDQTGDPTFTVVLRDASAVQRDIAPGEEVRDRIDVPFGSLETWFTLDRKTLIYVDVLDGSGATQWSLRDRDDRQIGTSQFSGLDLQTPADRVLTLGPGTYRLVHTTDVGQPADIAFALRDLSAPQTALPVDTQVSGSSAEGEILAWEFDGAAGERLFLDRLGARPTTLTVFDPTGKAVFSAAGTNDAGDLTLPVTGRYLVVADPVHQTARPVEFAFRLNRPVETVTEIVPGQTVTGSVDRAGDSRLYRLGVTAPGLYYFDVRGAVITTPWTISRDGRTLVGPTTVNSLDTSLLRLDAGTYEIRFDPVEAATGSFVFGITPAAEATPLEDNVAVDYRPDVAPQAQFFAWEATAGDRVDFSRLLNVGNVSVALIAPSGRVAQGFQSIRDLDDLVLHETGTYLFLVDPWSGQTETRAGFAVTKRGTTPPVDLTGQSIVPGETLSGVLTGADEVDRYVFTLTEPGRLTFDSLSNQSGAAFRLFDAVGQITDDWVLSNGPQTAVSRRDVVNDDPALELAAGTYLLEIAARRADAGSYAFRLVDHGAAPVLTDGVATEQLLSPGNGSIVFGLDVTAGERWTVEMTRDPALFAQTRVLDATGRQIATANAGTALTFTGGVTGRYSVMVETAAAATTPMTVTATAQQLVPEPLALGAVARADLPLGSFGDGA